MWWCCAVGGIFSPGIFRQKRLGQIFLRQRQDVGTVQYAISCRIHFPEEGEKVRPVLFSLFLCLPEAEMVGKSLSALSHAKICFGGTREISKRERNEGRLNFLCPDVLQTRNTDLFFAYMRILAFRTKCSTFFSHFLHLELCLFGKTGSAVSPANPTERCEFQSVLLIGGWMVMHSAQLRRGRRGGSKNPCSMFSTPPAPGD